ncbi:ribosomal protein L1 [Dothidotthia symphoricarpi CBS 119687]|uniref:Ribosomal protein L1 n=1 Tax=Dothidotthia symphoricarpi CBS 119687 TaxID=1392245 RepID=A0A6A6A0H2_9PLEO|nr:ribosomal protein L1 [Dothidotthia symphoricarpi CBS 119687]KAF2125310.1 ribosomal protein L1 [Dothidotthia symphoricarpi CBS 119687]
MAHARHLAAPLSRLTPLPLAAPSLSTTPRLATPLYQTIRCATTKAQPKKKKKARNTFLQQDLKKAQQFSLLDAMHYIRAFEVGRNPSSSKYEVHVRLRTLKNGPVVRNRLRLPHPVKTDIRICVIAAPDSKAAAEARAAGATLVGEDEVFALIKAGVVEFERCICHVDSLAKMNKAGLGRQLGPKGLMPSTKTGTVVTQVGTSVRNMVGASEYRERLGVIRMAVGQLGFTPDEMQRNVKAFMDALKKDIAQLGDRISKEVHEVVLSSTNAPGFTLNGDFRGANSISPKELSGPL